MTRRRRVLLAIVVVGAVVLGGVGLRILPLFTGPALPAGATRLHIATAPPNLNMSCAASALSSVRVASAGDELVLLTLETGQPVPVVWPSGFAAWRIDGRAVLADPWGSVVGREGDVLNSLGGGSGVGDAFHVCPFGIVTEH